jgi:hypothetical protein
MVLLRTWRKDEDGTYIVLYQSTTHRAVRPAAGWSWRSPVRVQVQAAGVTIAPLLPQYTAATGGESQESLVTLVLKADLGGLLSEGRGAGRLLSPLSGLGVRSMMEPVVTSIVVLRDRVEQNRFVVRPLSMTAGEEEAEKAAAAPAGAPAPAEAEALPGVARSSTMLVYRKQPLAVAQQLAAQRPAAEALVLDAGRKPAAAVAVVEPKRYAPAPATVPVAEADDAWAITGTCPARFWSSPGSCDFKVGSLPSLAPRRGATCQPPGAALPCRCGDGLNMQGLGWPPSCADPRARVLE